MMLLAALAAAGLALAAPPPPPQDADAVLQPSRSSPQSVVPVEFSHEGMSARREGSELVYLFRKVELRTATAVLAADRAVAFLDFEEYQRLFGETALRGDPLLPGPEPPRASARDVFAEIRQRAIESPVVSGPLLTLEDAPFLGALRVLYLEGDVRIRQGTRGSAAADAAYLDVSAGRLILLNGQVRWDFDRPGRPLPLVLKARLIRQEVPGIASARDADLTTCSLASPHYHVRAEELVLTAVGSREVAIDASGAAFDFTDAIALPIPNVSLFSTDLRFFPIESISAGHSKRDGGFVTIRLGRDFRDLGDEFNRALGVDGEFRGHWSVDLHAFGARGPAIGGTLVYETPGAYRGTTTGFFLDDRGSNRGFLSDVLTESSEQRGRVHTENRVFAGSDRTWIDVEASTSSDPLLRPEFFPTEFKTEKRHENVLYFRTAKDSASFTGLVKTEIDDFEPVVETGMNPGGVPPSTTNAYPLLDGRVFSTPIVSLPVPGTIDGKRDLDLVYRSRTNLGHLERHFSEAELAQQPTPVTRVDPFDPRATRFDTAHEFSLPFSFGVANLVPFVEARETIASARLDPMSPVPAASDRSLDRFLGTAGARIGSHLEGDLGSVRHVIDVLVEYRQRYEEMQAGTAFVPFDEVDGLGHDERVEIELRNRFSRVDPDTLRRSSFADLLVAVPYFPDPGRDNGGDSFGLVRGDFRFDFGRETDFLDLRLRSRALYDPHERRTRKSDSVAIVSPFGPEIDLSLAYRESLASYEAVALAASIRIGRKWDLDVLEQYDFLRNRSIQQRVALRRYGHDWAIELSFTFDTNDNSQSISVAILPLLGGSDRPGDRFFSPEPTFRGFY